jgi:hypothetical protein
MRKHTKIYLDAFGYKEGDFIPSELSNQRANDTHHIISRGKCGEDRIENLMALTREEHIYYGDKKQWMFFLLNRHYEYLKSQGVEFSKEYFDKQFHKYAYID